MPLSKARRKLLEFAERYVADPNAGAEADLLRAAGILEEELQRAGEVQDSQRSIAAVKAIALGQRYFVRDTRSGAGAWVRAKQHLMPQDATRQATVEVEVEEVIGQPISTLYHRGERFSINPSNLHVSQFKYEGDLS